MRIAQCLEYPIQQHGGTEVLVRELIAGLAPRHQIILVSNDDAESWQGSSVAPFLAGHIRWDPQRATAERAKDLAHRVREQNVDLAHFHFGGTFGWESRWPNRAPAIHLSRAGVPCVATNHGAFGAFEGYLGAQRSWLAKLALFPAAWLSRVQLTAHLEAEVAVSQNDYRALCRRFWPVRRKFRQIYHSQLRGPPPPATAERTKDILCIGTIGPRKGQTFLTEAFCQLAGRHPEWKLILIGRAGDASMVERINFLREKSRLTERIVLLGNQSDAEIKRWLRTAAIFAMPSVAEGLGLSLQEALFNGCACVTSRAGGTQDLIQNEDNGLMVEATDPDALAGALDRLMSDESLRHRFGARGPTSVLEKEMTADRMVEKYDRLYGAILAGQSR